MKKSITLLAVLAGTTAMAQQVFELPEITLSANLEETLVDQTGASVTVLDEDHLDQTVSTQIVTKIAKTPSVTFATNGGVGSTTSVSIRGAKQYYVGTYYDGIDITDPSNPQNFYDFGSLGAGTIGRAEILRGSQSALYGSNVIGGVISLQSKRPTEDGLHGDFEVYGGSFDTFGGSASLLFKNDSGEFGLNLEHFQTEGISAADEEGADDTTGADDNTETDPAKSTRVAMNGRVAVNENIAVGGTFFYQKNENEFDEFGPSDGSPGDEIAKGDQKGYRAFVEANYGNFNHEIYVSGMNTDRTSDQVNSFGPLSLGYSGERQTMGYRGSYNYSDANRLTVGVEQTHESYSDDYNNVEADFDLTSIFTELAIAPVENLDLTASIRHDDHSDFDTNTTYRIGAAYKPLAGVTLRGNWGTGYRAPSLYEQNYPFGGNPKLTAEESSSWDISAEYAWNDASYLRATYFDIEIENAIDYVSVDPANFISEYQNVDGTSTRKGFELEGETTIAEALDLRLAYTYTDATKENGDQLARAPKNNFVLGAVYNSDLGYSVGTTLTHVSGVLDEVSGVRYDLDDYTLLDARIGYEIGNGEIYLAGNNLTDADYQTAYGYGTVGRSFTLGYKFKF